MKVLFAKGLLIFYASALFIAICAVPGMSFKLYAALVVATSFIVTTIWWAVNTVVSSSLPNR